MRELRHETSGSPTDKKRNQQCRKYHHNTQPFEIETPTSILHKPEKYMQILHLAELLGNNIEVFILHVVLRV